MHGALRKKEKHSTSGEVFHFNFSKEINDALHQWLCQNGKAMILRIGIVEVGVEPLAHLTTLLQNSKHIHP
jgi:hypothetical protein